ncbi:MAG: proline dehydrogenase family protein, partial [Lacinutrix venerupis]
MTLKNIFDNTEVAFSLKSDSQLERAYFLFKMIANEPLVRIGTAATRFALKAKLPVEGLIRATVFDHFCGGVNEKDCLPVIDNMYTAGVCSVLDYSVEGKASENQFDDATERLIKIIEFSEKKDAMPIVVFKPTALGRFYLFQKRGEGKEFTKEEEAEWNRVIGRLDKLCNLAKASDVEVLIDAEEEVDVFRDIVV